MDNFSVYGTSFDNCLTNLEKVLKRCGEVDLVLNWEKCHFMVKEEIVLGHVISERERDGQSKDRNRGEIATTYGHQIFEELPRSCQIL